jgi:SAM-dependent methyltransferase
MTESQPRQLDNTEKADFFNIYNQPDPRDYFASLAPLCYQIPQQALPLFNRVLDISDRGTGPRKVLDVCCSYGINAALIRYNVSYDTLTKYYANSKLPPEKQISADKQFFASRLHRPDVIVFGLDIAPSAIHYATSTGLIANGWAENLEVADPSSDLNVALRDIGLIICTGGIGYVSAATFERIAAAVDDPADLWIVALVARTFSFDDVAATVLKYGLVTEKLPGVVFRQRRFTSPEEQNGAISQITSRGLDVRLESDGWFCAECYLVRPSADASRRPITEFLSCIESDTIIEDGL